MFKKGDKVELNVAVSGYKEGQQVEVTKAYEAVDFSTICYEINNDITVEEKDIRR